MRLDIVFLALLSPFLLLSRFKQLVLLFSLCLSVDLSLSVCTRVRACHMCISALGDQKGVSDPLELKLRWS